MNNFRNNKLNDFEKGSQDNKLITFTYAVKWLAKPPTIYSVVDYAYRHLIYTSNMATKYLETPSRAPSQVHTTIHIPSNVLAWCVATSRRHSNLNKIQYVREKNAGKLPIFNLQYSLLSHHVITLDVDRDFSNWMYWESFFKRWGRLPGTCYLINCSAQLWLVGNPQMSLAHFFERCPQNWQTARNFLWVY